MSRWCCVTALAVALTGGCSEAPKCSSHQGAHVVTMCWGDATYVAYRDGDSDWLEPEHKSGAAEWDLCVDDDFVVVAAYESPSDGTFRTYQVASTAAEGDPLGWCGDTGSDWNRRDVRVAGKMLQPGGVQIDGIGDGYQTAPWSFELSVATGVHDLVAYSSDNRVLVRRGLTISAATTFPTIDMDAEGVPLMSLPLSIDNLLPDESVTTRSELWMGPNDVAFLPDTRTTSAFLLPPELLRDTDSQYLTISATSALRFSRGVNVKFTGTETSFSYLPRLSVDTAAFDVADVPSVSWRSLPTEDFTQVQLEFFAGPSQSYQLAFASKQWIQMRGLSSLTLDLSAPGYRSSWRLDFSRSYTRTFSLLNEQDNVESSTSVSEVLNNPDPDALV